jgi:asparagine synthase (glutamine-hydrolysing)
VEKQVAAHAAEGRSWAEADAHDSFYPHDPIRAAGTVPTESPFLAPRFVSAALGVPLGRRFDPALPTAYQRCKAQVVHLFPPDLRASLPQAKQYFAAALTDLMPVDRAAPLATAAGLIDRETLAGEDDPSVLLMVAAAERWLAGAQTLLGSMLLPSRRTVPRQLELKLDRPRGHQRCEPLVEVAQGRAVVHSTHEVPQVGPEPGRVV